MPEFKVKFQAFCNSKIKDQGHYMTFLNSVFNFVQWLETFWSILKLLKVLNSLLLTWIFNILFIDMCNWHDVQNLGWVEFFCYEYIVCRDLQWCLHVFLVLTLTGLMNKKPGEIPPQESSFFIFLPPDFFFGLGDRYCCNFNIWWWSKGLLRHI